MSLYAIGSHAEKLLGYTLRWADEEEELTA